jgi:hypothetical protein
LSDFPPQLWAIISVLSGVVGGGLVTHVSNRKIKLREWQLQLSREQIADKRKAYVEFLGHAQTVVLHTVTASEKDLDKMSALHASFAMVELSGSAEVKAAATNLLKSVVAHFATIQKGKEGEFVFCKAAFIDAARADLLQHEDRAAKEMAK